MIEAMACGTPVIAFARLRARGDRRRRDGLHRRQHRGRGRSGAPTGERLIAARVAQSSNGDSPPTGWRRTISNLREHPAAGDDSRSNPVLDIERQVTIAHGSESELPSNAASPWRSSRRRKACRRKSRRAEPLRYPGDIVAARRPPPRSSTATRSPSSTTTATSAAHRAARRASTTRHALPIVCELLSRPPAAAPELDRAGRQCVPDRRPDQPRHLIVEDSCICRAN